LNKRTGWRIYSGSFKNSGGLRRPKAASCRSVWLEGINLPEALKRERRYLSIIGDEAPERRLQSIHLDEREIKLHFNLHGA
jgi:hypothetical protein